MGVFFGIAFGTFAVMVVFAVAFLLRTLLFGSVTRIKTKAKAKEATIVGKRKKDMMRSSGVYTNYFVTFDLALRESNPFVSER